MATTGRHPYRSSWLKRGLISGLSLLVLAIVLFVFRFHIYPASAHGLVSLGNSHGNLDVVISQVRTDDPLFHEEPGMYLDVAECRSSMLPGKQLTVRIFRGYPGYRCTLDVTVHNRGEQSVVLQRVDIESSEGLDVEALEAGEIVRIPAGEKRQLAYRISIQEQAAELAQLEFQIEQLFVPAETSLTVDN